jgi:hypothetical protein
MIRAQEQHLHRVFWRNMNTTRQLDVYVILSNSFGSASSCTVAIAAIHLIAEIKQTQYPESARVLKEQTYMDDIMDSCMDKETAYLRSREIDKILSLGSFKVKHWTFVDSNNLSVNSSNPELKINATENSVLGQKYDTSSDKFFFESSIKFSKKRRGVRVDPELRCEDIWDLQKIATMTKRMILSQVHSIYDPMAYLAPFIVELKFAMGKL